MRLKAELTSPTEKNPSSFLASSTTAAPTSSTTKSTATSSTTLSVTANTTSTASTTLAVKTLLLKKELITNSTTTDKTQSTSHTNAAEQGSLPTSQGQQQQQQLKSQPTIVHRSPVKSTHESATPTTPPSKSTSNTLQRRSIDGQTQTETILDEECQHVSSQQNNQTLSRNSPSSRFLTPQYQNNVGDGEEGDDVVDIVSEEEDLEITVSIESPNRPKKRRLGNLSPSTKGYHSAPQLRRQGREKTTRRRNQYKKDNGLVPLQHPRSILSNFPVSNSESSPRSLSRKQSSSSSITNNSEQGTGNVSSATNPSSFLNKNPAITERTCNICKYTFPNLTRARKHMKEAHNHNQLQQHHQQHQHQQPTNLASTKISDLTCTICFGLFRNNRELKSHMLLHTDSDNLHKCNVCLRTFRNKSTLQQHSLIHSEELPYTCETCGKRFRQQGHLILHMAKHSKNDEGYFSCPYCTNTFANEAIFRDHVRTHEAELPFGCNQCQERFENKSMFMMHLECHNEGKSFSCPICKKSFKTKTYLSGHMQMHRSSNTKTQEN